MQWGQPENFKINYFDVQPRQQYINCKRFADEIQCDSFKWCRTLWGLMRSIYYRSQLSQLNTKPHQSNLHGKHIKDKASSTSFLYFLFPYWTLVTLPSLFLVVVPECLIPIRYCARNLFSFWALSLSSTCGYWGHSPNWMLSYGKAKMWLYNILSSLGVCESPFLWLW